MLSICCTRLQSVQNAAAGLVTGAGRREPHHAVAEAASVAACEATNRL